MFPYGPHWYASVMGTGVVAIALTELPFSLPGATGLAIAFWILAILLLVAVTGAMVGAWRHDPALLRRHYDDPALAHFYGAPAMALLVAGAATLTPGTHVVGSSLALGIDAVLWPLGALLGLITAIAVPYRVITAHEVDGTSITGAWVMPVVPSIVTSATGALLVPHLPPGQARETMLLGCYAFFGLAVLVGFLVLGQFWQRLIRYGALPAATSPTVWIPLGFLGQSTTAVAHLGALAPGTVPGYGAALHAMTLCYGLPAWGFTMLWVALSTALTLRQIRIGLPFNPSWWSFTFPIGTVVTGTSALAEATGLVFFRVVAGVLLAMLLIGWIAAAAGTVSALFKTVGRPRDFRQEGQAG